jgi:nucleoid DNA-binding protein
MLKWKVAETDIIPLILNYENNDRIQQLGFVILVDLTLPLADILDNRNELESLLTDLQETIVNSQLIELLARSLLDSTSKLREASNMKESLKEVQNKNLSEADKQAEASEEEKKKISEIKQRIAEVENKSQTTIELIFVFLKQIINISFMEEIQRNVNMGLKLMSKLANLKILDAIIFHSKNYESEFYKRISGVILELVYFLSRPFNIPQMFQISNTKTQNAVNNNNFNYNSSEMSNLKKLIEEEKRQKMMRQEMYSTRPNKFGTMIKVARPLDNTSFIVTNVNQLLNDPNKVISDKMSSFASQRKKPRKGLNPKTKSTLASKAYEEIILVNDIRINETFRNFMDVQYEHTIIIFKSFFEDFLKFSFNNLVKHFFAEIHIDMRLEKYDIYHLKCLMSFFLEFNRFSQQDFIVKNNVNKKD